MCFLHVLKSMSEGKLSSLWQLLLFQLYLIVLKNPKEVSTVSISVSFRCSVHILEQGIIFWPDGLLHFSRVRHLIENNQLLHALQKNTWQLSFFKFFIPTFHFSECASISSDTWERDTLQGNVAVTHTGFQASQHLFIMRRQINATFRFYAVYEYPAVCCL